tara:strand:- start:458 stop:862 length:405 start_codon:yes stop_codon:yes gene_type:complete
MLVTNILTCLLILLVGILLYIVTLTDKVFKQVRQRAYDNFALSHKNFNDINSLKDKNKELSTKLLKTIVKYEKRIKTLEDKWVFYDIHDILSVEDKFKRNIKALEDRVEKNEIALGLKKDYPNLTFLPPKDWRR